MSQETIEVTISDPNGEIQIFQMEASEFTIGRGDHNDIILNVPGVSRVHAKVNLKDGKLLIKDESTNGMFFRGEKTPKTFIFPFEAVLQIFHFGVSFKILKDTLDEQDQASLFVDDEENTDTDIKYSSEEDLDIFKRKIHHDLIESLDLFTINTKQLNDPEFIERMENLLKSLLDKHQTEIPPDADLTQLKKEIMNEALGLGPLEDLLDDPAVSEIMVVDHKHIYVERSGRLELDKSTFSSPERVKAIIERIVTPLGRRIDESAPLVDARLKDGSRVNAVIPPLALKGPCITIRKFSKDPLKVKDLVGFGAFNDEMALFLERTVTIAKNVIISGGTGSGKTTLLNVLSSFIPHEERIVTIEDAAELQLQQEHVVSLETKPPNLEGKGEYAIRDLVKNALRMRPDRIVVGECRGGETFDMLQAMNTGHEGSMTTLHSNSPTEAIGRLETMILMSGMEIPIKAIREQISSSVHIIIQQSRFSDGSRRIKNITEVVGIDDHGMLILEDIFIWKQTGINKKGKLDGYFMKTGYLPSFLGDFIKMGLISDGNYF